MGFISITYPVSVAVTAVDAFVYPFVNVFEYMLPLYGSTVFIISGCIIVFALFSVISTPEPISLL